MELGLSGKVVVVTGATANIGREIVLEMAKEGARLVAVGRDTEAGARVVREAKTLGAADALFLAADLLKQDCGEQIRNATAKAFGPVDILVNNVGGNADFGMFAESDPSTWLQDIDINYLSMLRVTRAILPDMIARKGGSIVNLGSIAGLVGDYMFAVYAGAKGAVHAFTKSLAKEVGQHNVRVNCVAPYGTVADDPSAFSKGSRFHPEGFFAKAFASTSPAQMAKLQRQGPLERNLGKPGDIAAAVLYLASERASFVTGEVLPIAGGTLL